MQMSKRINKTKHTIRPVTKPAGKKTRFDKPNKVKRRQRRETFTDLSQLKDKMEEQEMRMGGTSVNAAKIMKEVTKQDNVIIIPPEDIVVKDLPSLPESNRTDVEETLEANTQTLDEKLDDANETVSDAVVEEEKSDINKVGIFGALRLGLRDTIMGQVVTAVMGR